MFPQSIEVQMKAGDAGDFWVIQEDIEVPDMEARRPKKDPQQKFGRHRGRRPPDREPDRRFGEAAGRVEQHGGRGPRRHHQGLGQRHLVNEGTKATATSGKLALQAEGTEVEFRKVEIGPLPKVKPAKRSGRWLRR